MRCRACNDVMQETDIIWDEERGQHEDLCGPCRLAVLDAMIETETLRSLESDDEHTAD